MNKTLQLTLALLLAAPVAAFASGGIPLATEWTFALDGARIINSAVVLGLFAWILLKYVFPVLKNRSHSIAAELADLEKAKKEAEEKLTEQEARLRQIEEEAKAITEEAKAEGEKLKEKIVAQAEESAKRIVEKASEQIALETENAAKRLQAETMRAAVTLAEEIIKKNIGPDDQARLVNSYLANVEKLN